MKYNTSILLEKRLVRGWSQSTLAELIHVDPSTIGRVERGEFTKPQTVKKMADALGVDMEDLLVREPETQPAA